MRIFWCKDKGWKSSFAKHLHSGCSEYAVRLESDTKGKMAKCEYSEKCILASGCRKPLYH